MNSTFLKFFTFINIFFLFQSFGVSTERIVNFERECVETDFEEGSEAYTECLAKYEDLEEFLVINDQEGAEQRTRECNVEESLPTPTGLEALSEEVTVASTKMSCTPEDQEEVASSCQDQLFCNAGRSVVKVLNNMPFTSGIAERTSDFFKSRVGSDQAESCMDEEKSNCLTEVFTSYVANILGTVNSLGTIASGIGSTISSIFWSNKEYVEEKSDDLHAFAATKASFISRLYNNPGKTIMESLTSFKNSVDNWIKSEVFCQDWRREPHDLPTEEEIAAGMTSTCDQPLESYSCLNCNDGLNAFCAGAGVFLSEGMIAMLTAGTASAVSLGARAGVMAVRGAAASRRGAELISSKVPLIGRMSETVSSGASRGIASVADDAVVATARTTGVLARVDDVKRVVGAFASKIESLRVVRFVTAPVRAIDNVAERMVSRMTRRAATVRGDGLIARNVRRAARQDYRAARVAKGSIDVSRARVPRSIVAGTRLLRKSNSPRRSRVSNNGAPEAGPSGPATSGDRRDEPPSRTGSETREDRSEGLARDQRTERERAEAERTERERTRREEEEREQELRLAEAALRAERLRANPALAATRAALVADLAAKSINALSNGSSQVAEKMLSEDALQGNDAGVSGLAEQPQGDIKTAIEERVGEIFSDQEGAAQFADNMNNIYSDENKRDELIDNFVRERGISRSEATRAYESERDFYSQASQGFSNQYSTRAIAEATAAAGRQPSSVTTEAPNIGELIDSAQSIGRIKQSLADLEAENKLIEEEIAEERARVSDVDSAIVSPVENELARVVSTSPRSGGSGGVQRGLVASSGPSLPVGVSQGITPDTEEGVIAAVNSGALVTDEEIAEQEALLATERKKAEQANAAASDREALESSLRVERSNLLSDLMNLLTSSDSMSFRNLSTGERKLLAAHSTKLSNQLEMDSVRVLEISSQGKNYLAYKDLQSNKTIFIEAITGRYIERIPTDLF